MADNEMAEGEPMPADPNHPRQHSLTMAAAKHLRTAGHITGKLHNQIVKDAKGALKEHKKKKIAAPFGSLSPTLSSRYMSTRQIQPGPGVVNPPMEE